MDTGTQALLLLLHRPLQLQRRRIRLRLEPLDQLHAHQDMNHQQRPPARATPGTSLGGLLYLEGVMETVGHQDVSTTRATTMPIGTRDLEEMGNQVED